MTVGWPMAQTEIKIIDPETGETVPVGAIGEICARGYSVMKDYFDNPEATREVLDADGWLRTGDLGSLDEHGYCRVQGRQKDMIIRGGEKFIPARSRTCSTITHWFRQYPSLVFRTRTGARYSAPSCRSKPERRSTNMNSLDFADPGSPLSRSLHLEIRRAISADGFRKNSEVPPA